MGRYKCKIQTVFKSVQIRVPIVDVYWERG